MSREEDRRAAFTPVGEAPDQLTPRQKMMIVLPAVAVLVIALVYLGLFSNPLVIAAIFVLYVVVSLLNRRKFRRQEAGGTSTRSS